MSPEPEFFADTLPLDCLVGIDDTPMRVELEFSLLAPHHDFLSCVQDVHGSDSTRLLGRPLRVTVNGRILGYGELILSQDGLGVRLTSVTSRDECLLRLCQ